MTDSELSPCPFCGGPAVVREVYVTDRVVPQWWAGCMECGAYMRASIALSDSDDVRAGVIERWNRRRRRSDK